MINTDSKNIDKDYKNILTVPTISEYETSLTNSNQDSAHLFSPVNTINVSGEFSILISVFDVASYILLSLGKMTTMKLHKLLYYTQAWNLVWEEKPLFKEKIEAWANGPVIRELFNFHKGMYEIEASDITLGNISKIPESYIENIDSVLSFYGNKSAQWLIDQTHFETPWRNARIGLTPNERGGNEISLEDMMEYYSSLK